MGAPKKERKVGPIVATLIIVLIVIVAALYLFASKINQSSDTASTPRAAQTQATQVNTQEDISSLQSEVNDSTSGLDDQNF